MHATYHRLIPPIDASTTPHCSREFEFHTFHKHQIEVLPAGEEGPRRLDSGTVMTVAGLPVLTMSEFIRAKLKAWVMYASIDSFRVSLSSFLVGVWTTMLKTSCTRSLVIGIGWTSTGSLNRTCASS